MLHAACHGAMLLYSLEATMDISHSHLRWSVVYANGRRSSWEFSITEDECGYTRATNIIDVIDEPLVFAKLEFVEPDGSTTPWFPEEKLLPEPGPIPF